MNRLWLTTLSVLLTLTLFGALPVIADKRARRSATIEPTGQTSNFEPNASAQPVRNCDGFSHRPHDSGHFNGTVNAQGQRGAPLPIQQSTSSLNSSKAVSL